MPGPDFGVYLHIPFCARRCDYCAFATWTDRHHLVDAYLDALVVELGRAVDEGLPEATSVFVGGGTPSLVGPALTRVLDAVPRRADAEVSVECNPDTVTDELVDAYAEAGVTRLSLGVQSLVPHVLEALGRTHTPANVARAVDSARRAGIVELNVDVIYGARVESLDDWARTLDGVVGLAPTHVSAYALTVEAGTALADDPRRHPDDDDQADKYVLTDEVLGAAGHQWYEISNWSMPGHRCRHNLLYWSQGEYLGVGCAAHSHRSGRRWWNLRTPERYLDAVARGDSSEAGAESLDGEHRSLEAAQLALRTSGGVRADVFEPGALDELAGLVERGPEGRVVLTVRGRLLANEVALRLRGAA